MSIKLSRKIEEWAVCGFAVCVAMPLGLHLLGVDQPWWRLSFGSSCISIGVVYLKSWLQVIDEDDK